jgi:hypothetical protein
MQVFCVYQRLTPIRLHQVAVKGFCRDIASC